MTSLSELQQRFLNIATDGRLSPKQKSNFLALEAEACIPYMPISEALREAMSDGVICDMFEGHAPFKPRYVLPDYAKFLSKGSEYLELSPAEDFDDALNMLTIIYHHVPSVTNIPVYLGQLDDVLMPYVGDQTEAQIYKKTSTFLDHVGSHVAGCLHAREYRADRQHYLSHYFACGRRAQANCTKSHVYVRRIDHTR